MHTVTPERSGWRDESISRRHRLWGISCSAVDLDFLLLEFNYQEPVALVEYKHASATVRGLQSGRYAALSNLCDGFHKLDGVSFVHSPLACLIAFYDPETWIFRVEPLNARARDHYKHTTRGEALSEYRFVKSLILLRKEVLTAEDKAALNRLSGAQHG